MFGSPAVYPVDILTLQYAASTNAGYVLILISFFKVTLAFATYRGFPWKKVPVRKSHLKFRRSINLWRQIYIFAQVMGGLVGAGLVYANYIHAIDIVEGGRDIRTQATASLFSTYAVSRGFLRDKVTLILSFCSSYRT